MVGASKAASSKKEAAIRWALADGKGKMVESVRECGKEMKLMDSPNPFSPLENAILDSTRIIADMAMERRLMLRETLKKEDGKRVYSKNKTDAVCAS